MNTLIVTLLIYRYKSLKNLSSSSSNSGFTLLEMLITVIILGILAAFAFPSYVATIDKFKYGDAKIQMSCMAKELRIFRLENGYYPKDVYPNIVPVSQQGTPATKCFYLQSSGKVPFNSSYDYEARPTTVNGKSYCAIYVVFSGKDTVKNTTTYYTNAYKETNQFFQYQDDLIMSIDMSEQSLCM
ncbi:prepilin-type N-terminal cleavage/methylation domain-containing protein [Gloeothece verrucosa]|uniref:Uncharacterized protein n=1 Tax=Gloeothece verrucosa (strain PCC 7822) TaxID=497965 RepID=E0UII2_GLOV7|nr:prepilin-type N-terminal cleavage/methylation domain-containing protein [Gloeothece verrucosa]ADN12176.1 conserved hypothetical protein [Gloeothece verrucosa PCC 7822]